MKHCSFCGRDETQVVALVCDPNAQFFICNGCLDDAQLIVAKYKEELNGQQASPAPQPVRDETPVS